MSAFIVEDESIGRIASIIKYGYRNHDMEHQRRQIKELGCDLTTRAGFQEFCKILHGLNIAAVDQRYREHNCIEEVIYPEIVIRDKLQDLKTVQCFLYQCSEGTIPETPLYNFIDKLSGTIAQEIIENLPDYEKKKWG
jgi:hypothetical protein